MRLSLPLVALVTLLPLAIGCAAAQNDDAGASDSNVTSARVLEVKGDDAERIIASLEAFDAVEHAMGGRADVTVANVDCVSHSNDALDGIEGRIPTFDCTLERAGGASGEKTVADPLAKARALFAALDAADVGLVDSATGKSYGIAKALSCEGQDEVATCKGTRDDGTPFTLSGDKALAVANGLDLADAMQHAMGGVYDGAVTDLLCVSSSNGAIDPKLPEFAIESVSCEMSVADRTPAKVALKDAAPKAEALLSSLVNAGLVKDGASGGVEGVSASRVTCRKGPGEPTVCAIAR